MVNLKINLPELMKQFVDSEVRSGRFKDASAYLQLLIAEAMETQKTSFSDEETERIDRLLVESLDSFERGDCAPVRPGEFEDLAKQMVEQHQGKKAS